MNFLAWITQSVRNAVVKGFEQAAADLELNHAAGDDAAPLALLEGRMAALPAPPRSDNEESRPARSKAKPSAA